MLLYFLLGNLKTTIIICSAHLTLFGATFDQKHLTFDPPKRAKRVWVKVNCQLSHVNCQHRAERDARFLPACLHTLKDLLNGVCDRITGDLTKIFLFHHAYFGCGFAKPFRHIIYASKFSLRLAQNNRGSSRKFL
ncbi:MAG: hypothetical protein UW27_C0013G0001 [Parcubacteria group bacterium GW2011_GWA1_44_13]|nr:MAG: hypothetical protein UW27_C0013G0001 [Parcubacteria group bacterium GW2011_GWA1_44_13]